MPETTSRFNLRGSPVLAAWLVAVHGGAVLAVWGSAMPVIVAGAFSVLSACVLVRDLRLHAMRSARGAVVWLELEPGLRLGFADGRECGARLRARPLVHPRLLILRFASEAGHGVLLVPADSLPSRTAHKTIRRCLRHGVSR